MEKKHGGHKGFSREGPHDVARWIKQIVSKYVQCPFPRCRSFHHVAGYSAWSERACDKHPCVCLDRHKLLDTKIYYGPAQDRPQN